MSAKPLTDELNTVLRGHALQAPAPAATIEAVLARTIRSADPAAVGLPAGVPRNRWRPSRALLGVAAAAVLVVAAGLGLNAARSPSSTSGSTASSAKAAAGDAATRSGGQVPAVGGTGVKVPGAALPGAPLPGAAVPSAALPDAGGSASAGSAVVSATCITPGARAVTSSLGRLQADLAPSPLQVVLTQCLDAHGDVVASQLDLQTTAPAVLHTLIDQRQAVHVTGARTAGGTVIAAGYSPGRGGSFTYRFAVSPDGATVTAAKPVLVAATCRAANLALTAGPGQDGARTVLIRLRNTSTVPCALQGYPTVTPRPAGNPSGSAFPLASGPLGVGGTPVVLLSAGAAATSLVDGGAPSGSCASVGQLSVSVPQLGVNGVVAVNLRVCAVQVHPFIAGQTGSG